MRHVDSGAAQPRPRGPSLECLPLCVSERVRDVKRAPTMEGLPPTL